MKTTICQGCEEQEATHRVTITDVDDIIEDAVYVCYDCLNYVRIKVVGKAVSITL